MGTLLILFSRTFQHRRCRRLQRACAILGGHMRPFITVLGVIGISAALMASPARALESDQLSLSYTAGMNGVTAHMGFTDGAGGVLGDVATGSVLGVDTIPTF